jgi:hypothetical protein
LHANLKASSTKKTKAVHLEIETQTGAIKTGTGFNDVTIF